MGEVANVRTEGRLSEAVAKCHAARTQAVARRDREDIKPIKKDLLDLVGKLGVTQAHLDGTMPLERSPETMHAIPRIFLPAPYVAAKFRDATLDTYQPHPDHRSQRVALDKVRTFCRSIHSGEPQLLALIGPPGTGKSHLLYAAAKALHSVGHRVFARPWYLLADQLRYGGPGPWAPAILDPQELRSTLHAESIVMIDEVRPTAGTDFDDTELAKVVLHAYDNDRSVLVTTNVNPLTDVVGPAVASRFTQVIVTGPDHRQGAAQ